MKRRSVLPFTTAVVLFATASPAQQSLPASYQAHMATVARVESMTQTDLGQLVSKAQAGEPEAQHVLAWSTSGVVLYPETSPRRLARCGSLRNKDTCLPKKEWVHYIGPRAPIPTARTPSDGFTLRLPRAMPRHSFGWVLVMRRVVLE